MVGVVAATGEAAADRQFSKTPLARSRSPSRMARLTEYAVTASGSRELAGNVVKQSRTTTTTISQVDSAKVALPADAREILDALVAGRTPNVFVPEPGFKKLFNGHDLTGWAGRSEHWSVQDGAITGKSTKETPAKGNNFLIAKNGDKNLIVDDFELRFSYRITADNDRGFANSGVQYRSQDLGNFVAGGYQADFEAGNRHSGILYDEAGGAGRRGIMAQRGELVTWTADGKKTVTGRLGSSAEIQAKIKPNDWNEYVIIAEGNRLQHFINGVQTVGVVDQTEGKRLSSGILALQLHAGEPMTVAVQGHSHPIAGHGGPGRRRQYQARQGFSDRAALHRATGNARLVGRDVPRSQGPADRVGPERRAVPRHAADVGRRGNSRSRRSTSISASRTGCCGPIDSLYVAVNEGSRPHGVYRVRDTDGDDRLDKVELLGRCRPAASTASTRWCRRPDGKSIYVVIGNQSSLTEMASVAGAVQLGRGRTAAADADRLHGRFVRAARLCLANVARRQGVGADRDGLPQPLRHRVQPRRRAFHVRRGHGVGHRHAVVSAHARQPRHQRRASSAFATATANGRTITSTASARR